jgi:uncharacterized protein
VDVRDDRWHELTEAECHKLLAERHLGRLALDDQDGPLVLPVNYVLDEGTVLFRTGEGGVLHGAARGGRVAFEVDAVEEASRTGWSVLVRGRAAEVTDPAELTRVRRLALSPWAPGRRDRYVRIRPERITGRRIALPADLPSNWWG